MTAIRVSICGMSKLLGSFVAGILDADPEIEIVDGDCTDDPDWLGGAQVLLVADDAMNGLRPFSSEWENGKALGIVALSKDCSEAHVVRLIAHNWKIDQSDKVTLSEAIRHAARGIRGHA